VQTSAGKAGTGHKRIARAVLQLAWPANPASRGRVLRCRHARLLRKGLVSTF
jgi:hypothetical protein